MAQLKSSWFVGDIYESIGFEFETRDGDRFYHKGRGQLVEALYNPEIENYDTSVRVEFVATFERGKLEDEFVSFAKRPSKIKVIDGPAHMLSGSSSSRPGTGLKFSTEAKCPFCGSSLRTEMAKQCPTCFKSWRE